MTGTRKVDELDSGIDLELTLPLKPSDFELKRHLVTLIVGQVLEDDAVLFDADVELWGDFLGESELPDFGVLVKFSWEMSVCTRQDLT